MLEIKVERIHPDAKLPICAHPGEDLCYDLHSVAEIVLRPFVPTLVPTGIKLQLPVGYGAIIRPRSGLSKVGIAVGGGEIDNGYRGEVFVMLTLVRPDVSYTVLVGDRIAQIRPSLIHTSTIPMVEGVITDQTTRGAAGFGSTGR